MTTGNIFRYALPAMAALLIGLPATARGAAWFDDFEDGSVKDGNPFTWSQDLFGFFPGNYTVVDGSYTLSNPGNGATNDQQLTWNDGVLFADTYLRAQGRVLPGSAPEDTGGNLALLARIDTGTVSGYILYFDSGGQLGLQLALGGAASDLTPTVSLPFTALDEVVLELNIVGYQLSGYAWRAGESKPATPQITAVDEGSTIPGGKAGIAFDEDDDNTTGVFRFAAAQSTPFVDAVPGDFNGDGKVDGADFAKWGTDFGSSLDGGDLLAWQQNFGAGASVAAAMSVPEPAGCVLLLLAAGGGAARRRR